MRCFRICPQQYLENYSGLGASYKNGARWNLAGEPVLYFAQSPATALLEMSNYLPSPRLIPKSYRLGIYQIADTTPLDIIEHDDLPEDWASFPYPISTQKIGSNWLKTGKSLGLLVPSTAVPAGLENIIVINPLHAEAQSIRLVNSISELFNKRTFSGL